MTKISSSLIRRLSAASYGLVFFMFLTGSLGCTGKAFKRQLVDQNRQAGQLIAKQAIVLTVRQAGLDIEANSIEHQAWIGKPKTSNPYSPEQSASIRAQSKQARESSIWLKIKNFFGGVIMEAIFDLVTTYFPQFGGITGVLFGIFGLIKKWKADKKVMAGYDSANKIMKIARSGNALTLDGIKSILSESQAIWNVGPDVQKDLQKLWSKGQISKVKEPPKVV